MNELALKYGCNPNQKPARIFMREGELPVTVLSGKPGYINFLDAFNAWQLVRELRAATGLPCAASFKHVSPAGAACGLPLDETDRRSFFVTDMPLSPLACAYARARGADRVCSYGDWAALSDVCDKETAALIAREVSDGVIAPGYTDEALATFEQGRNECVIDESLLGNIVTRSRELSESARRDLLIALITLKYTQSNSVCYAKDGQAIGVGAGQQSRIHCTRLAGGKADLWHLRRHPRTLALRFVPNLPRASRDNAIDVYLSDEYEDILEDGVWQQSFAERPEPLTREEKRDYLRGVTGVALGSDAFFPFGDNIERAHKSGVCCIAQPGGSIRDDNVIEVCDKYGITMAFTGLRLFHH
ncbi:MAG: 5-aminoimidazole-4-carboxamide ribonucleotide transformylase [Clostridium sp. SCN 57-10]|nr:MAG: 5-aminoimidazole-4-carboxamide ribonucleotide transformylase [Clostridium sp. SCN 57-10]